MRNHWHVVILAGGKGSRFWPLSRPDRPKPFLALTGDTSLLQLTYQRALKLVDGGRILIVANRQHRRLVRRQLPRLPTRQLLLEPVGRNTAPAIGLAATHLLARNPEAAMIVLPADHYIGHVPRFIAAIHRAQQLVTATGGLVTLGIRPTEPTPGFGYLMLGHRVHGGYEVAQFIEKPSRRQAARLLKRHRMLWNSGIFLWRASVIADQIRRFLPTLGRRLDQGRPLSRWYPQAPAISIDYGVLEHARRVYAIPSNFDWQDVGSWSAIEAFGARDRWRNAVVGHHVGVKTRRSLIVNRSGQRVATIGLDRMIVVTTPEAVLVCPKDQDQAVRDLVEVLE